MSESIEKLRQRWEDDPSPQLSLKLAEEYRRQDRRKDAVHILSLALEDHPDHVAARVALGRYQLEMGETEEAFQLLERVVNEDPTHLIASKLLVGLYLEQGNERQARDRLDLYKLLNESDPEIDSLEALISGGKKPEVPTVIIVDIPRNGDPFRSPWGQDDDAAYWQALGAEGIFPVAGKPAVVSRQTIEIPLVSEEAPGATVTLANLYLQQGHFDDAEAAFGEVLQREPANTEALAGLDEARKMRSEGLVVAETEAAAPTDGSSGVDTKSRKIEVLKDYLQRIRAAGNNSR